MNIMLRIISGKRLHESIIRAVIHPSTECAHLIPSIILFGGMGTHLLVFGCWKWSPLVPKRGCHFGPPFLALVIVFSSFCGKKGVHFGSLFLVPWVQIFGLNGGSQFNVVGILTLEHAKLPECTARVALPAQKNPESRICIMHKT